jgi:predicted MFS family arabinose efflux permease
MSASSTDSSASLRAWLSVFSVALGAFAFVTTEYLPVGILPQIATDLEVSQGTAGLMVTVPGIIAAISAPALLFGAGRVNRRLILLLLSVVLLASNLISAYADSFPVMLAGRALLGAALGGFWTVALGASGRLVNPQSGAKAMAIIFAGITFATVLGVPFGTFISHLFSWRASFIATSLLVAVALIAQALLLPSLPSQGTVSVRGLAALIRRGNPRRGALLTLLVIGAHFSAYTYIAPLLEQSHLFGPSMITILLLGFGIVGMLSNFAISTPASKNLSASLFAMVGLLMLALASLPLLQGESWGLILAVLAWGVAYGAVPLCLSLWMSQSTPDLPEAGSAMLVSAFQVAIATGSFGGGLVVDHLGVAASMWVGAVLAALSLIAIASFGLGHRDLATAKAA